ncbi:MAG: hypothetical protein ACD_76C00045G0010 [uncultured bacterium]|nr:MAG: hypothetical protein ACD_76C00045G0010 [uncultured bacterium]HBD05218.1 hypothetical protein [Candidatus Uhrbacteria bacterium]
MSYKSMDEFPSPRLSGEEVIKRIKDYVARGLTDKEASDLVQIEQVEALDSVHVPLSGAEKARKEVYLKKLNTEK